MRVQKEYLKRIERAFRTYLDSHPEKKEAQVGDIQYELAVYNRGRAGEERRAAIVTKLGGSVQIYVAQTRLAKKDCQTDLVTSENRIKRSSEDIIHCLERWARGENIPLPVN